MFRHTRILLLLFALFFAADARAQTAAQAAATPTPTSAPKTKKEKPRYETVQFESKLVGAALPYNVILPADYKRGSSKHRRYPVVYLLHGLKGGAGDWVSSRAHLADYAAQYPFIIVVPEGHDGWYTDSATVPNEKYESYIVEELIPDVDRRFRTIASREGRAVAGLSMGGYGSLKFGLKHPELFVFAASMSGALSAPSWPPAAPSPGWVIPSIARAYGETSTPTRQRHLPNHPRTAADGRRLAPVFLSRLRHRRRSRHRQQKFLGAPHREENPARVPRASRHAQLALLGQAGAGDFETGRAETLART